MRPAKQAPTRESERVVRGKLVRAFRELRDQGAVTRRDFQDCQTCAWALLRRTYGGDALDAMTVVYWTQADQRHAFEHKALLGVLYLRWSGDADLIVRTLRKHGLRVEHDGSPRSVIGVLPPATAEHYYTPRVGGDACWICHLPGRTSLDTHTPVRKFGY